MLDPLTMMTSQVVTHNTAITQTSHYWEITFLTWWLSLFEIQAGTPRDQSCMCYRVDLED